MGYSRNDFRIFEQRTYINSCSYGALADTVEGAIRQYLDDRNTYGERWPVWIEMLETLRHKTAAVLGAATADEIAMTASLSAGLNALVSGMAFDGARRKVVCTDFDFPTTAQIWHAQKRRGAEIVRVDLEGLDNAEQAICDQIDDATAAVSIPLVCYRHGRKLDVATVAQKARLHGALMIVDAYQGIGTMPFDVRALDVDVVLGGYLKYLLGTSGVAYMYVRDAVSRSLAPFTSGWFSQDDVSAMSIEENTPAPSARKFEGGTPDICGIYACIAGLDIIESVTLSAIEQQVDAVTGLIKAAAEENGWQLAAGELPHGPMVAIRSTDMYQLVGKLRDENVIVSCRDDNIRISPHFYNNAADVEALVAGLKRHRSLLR